MIKSFKVLSVSTVKSGGSQILKLAGDESLSLLATGKKPQQRWRNMLKVKDILWLAKRKQLLLLHCVKVLFFSKCTDWKNVRRLKNRLAIKSLLRCTHFLARNHIAHTMGTSLILLWLVEVKTWNNSSTKLGKCSLHLKRCCSWLCWGTWHMGWWITPCKATKCSLLRFACRWVYWHYNNRRTVSCISLGWERPACWAFHRDHPTKEGRCPDDLLDSGWLFEGERSAH